MDKEKGTGKEFTSFVDEGKAGPLGFSSKMAWQKEKGGVDNRRTGNKPFRLPVAEPAPEGEQRHYWQVLRTFFRSGKGGGIVFAEGEPKTYPALLAPFQRSEYLRGPFPCWIADLSTFEREGTARQPFQTLYYLLLNVVSGFAPDEKDAKILKDNLVRLERNIHQKLVFAEGAYQALPVFEEALQELELQLSVKGKEGEEFSRDIETLKRNLPNTGVLIPFFPAAPLYILATLLPNLLVERRQVLQAEIQDVVNQLEDILTVEREKSPEASSSQQLQTAMDFADSFLNFEQLSSILPSGGSEVMPAARQHRIEKILKMLERAREVLYSRDAAIVLHEDLQEGLDLDWQQVFSSSQIIVGSKKEMWQTAKAVFDDFMSSAAGIFGALRMGKLEIADRYVPDVHDNFFSHFDWRSFTGSEMLACPPVFTIAGESSLGGTGFNDFSALLSSNRPVKCLMVRSIPDTADDSLESTGFAFRQEPGALVVAHRNVYVLQTSVADPEYLFKGLEQGISSFSPAFFNVLTTGQDNMDSYLWAMAAVEGREFPSFIYDPRKGPQWGARFDIGSNPASGSDWPEHQIMVEFQGQEPEKYAISFTFADFAAQDRRFADMLHVVPPRYWNDDLIPLSEYLVLPDEKAYAKVPFIWMIDENDELQKAAVALPVAFAARERLDFWHFLQENAGIHSYHVERAIDQLKSEFEERLAGKIDALKTEHQEEVKGVKEQSAREAMEKLASFLLDLDDSLFDISTSVKTALPAEEMPSEEEAREEPEEETETAEGAFEPEPEVSETSSLGEAWIETPLCTSCNECKDINDRIFAYDANKQAYIADPRGGLFADIVKAAEKCPVHIIHPGAPQNPDEPGLEEWIERAKPYN